MSRVIFWKGCDSLVWCCVLVPIRQAKVLAASGVAFIAHSESDRANTEQLM